MRSQNHWFYRYPGSQLKIQAFNDILDAAILSVPVCGEDVEVMERFTYLGSDIHVSAGCESEVIDVWVVPGESWIHWIRGCCCCRYLCGRTKVRVFRSLVLPVLLSGCETWTLTRDLRWRLIPLPRILRRDLVPIVGWTLCPTISC